MFVLVELTLYVSEGVDGEAMADVEVVGMGVWATSVGVFPSIVLLLVLLTGTALTTKIKLKKEIKKTDKADKKIN